MCHHALLRHRPAMAIGIELLLLVAGLYGSVLEPEKALNKVAVTPPSPLPLISIVGPQALLRLSVARFAPPMQNPVALRPDPASPHRALVAAPPCFPLHRSTPTSSCPPRILSPLLRIRGLLRSAAAEHTGPRCCPLDSTGHRPKRRSPRRSFGHQGRLHRMRPYRRTDICRPHGERPWHCHGSHHHSRATLGDCLRWAHPHRASGPS